MLYIRTNYNAPNYRIMISSIPAGIKNGTDLAAERWRQLECVVPDVCHEVVGASETVTVRTLRVFSQHLVLEGREYGTSRIWIVSLTTDDQAEVVHEVEVPIASNGSVLAAEYNLSTLSLDMQQNFNSDSVRLVHSSLTSPEQVLECAWPEQRVVEEGIVKKPAFSDTNASYDSKQWWELRVVKVTDVPGFSADEYRSWRLWAPAAKDSDVRIPISCVERRRPDSAINEPHPTLLYGYGSYGELRIYLYVYMHVEI